MSDGCRERFAGIEREELNFTPHSVRGGDQRWECGPLDVEVTGDYEVTASGVENLVSVDTFFGGDVPQQATFLAVAMLTHLDAPDGSRFQVGFN
ncbi:MAG TPA: hypothetical protein VM840_11165, partial [Actinomycetota bacterium]|nr:hypothetical protein [Actinomycetota bacterium]